MSRQATVIAVGIIGSHLVGFRTMPGDAVREVLAGDIMPGPCPDSLPPPDPPPLPGFTIPLASDAAGDDRVVMAGSRRPLLPNPPLAEPLDPGGEELLPISGELGLDSVEGMADIRAMAGPDLMGPDSDEGPPDPPPAVAKPYALPLPAGTLAAEVMRLLGPDTPLPAAGARTAPSGLTPAVARPLPSSLLVAPERRGKPC